MLFLISPGVNSGVEVTQNVNWGGGRVFGNNVPQFFPVFFSVFVVLWSLVRRISSDEGRVMSPGSDLDFDDAVCVWYYC